MTALCVEVDVIESRPVCAFPYQIRTLMLYFMFCQVLVALAVTLIRVQTNARAAHLRVSPLTACRMLFAAICYLKEDFAAF